MKNILQKISAAIILLSIPLINACSKGGDTTTQPQPVAAKTYLLKRVTTTGAANGGVSTDEYYYDDKDRVSEVHFYSGAIIYKYTYDLNNKLATTETYNSGKFYLTESYTYSDNAINIKDVFYDKTTANQNIELVNNKISKINLTLFGETYIYDYDAKGNIITMKTAGTPLPGTYNYTYDDKKHPLTMISAANFHLTYMARLHPYSFVNNVTYSNYLGFGKRTFTYNADGYPTNCVIDDTDNKITSNVTFEYTVK